jgi:ElaB/YqjD/DUF883 family membrane-anchored ribosome-binding protein
MARSITVARLFYQLEANTKGLDRDLQGVEKSFGRTAAFIKANPAAALTGLATAALAVGVQATQMAAEVDTALRKISASLPEAAGRMDDLKKVTRDLSIEFGVSQAQVARNMETVAKTGVRSVEEMIAVTRAGMLAAKATGGEFTSIVQGLDGVLDSFGIAGSEAERVLAKLFVTAQGKTTLEDMLATFGRLSPLVQDSGLSFDDMSAAVATLIDRGRTTKQVVSELGQVFREQGAEGLRALAAQSTVASDGLAEMRSQFDLNNSSLEALNARLKQQFAAQMIELGQTILPLAIRGMKHLLQLISALKGDARSVVLDSSRATIDSLSNSIGKLQNEASRQDGVKRLMESIRQLAGNPDLLAFQNRLQQLSGQDLVRLQKGYEAAAASGALTAREAREVERALAKVSAEIQRRPAGDLIPPVPPETGRRLDEARDGIGAVTAAGRDLRNMSLDALEALKDKLAGVVAAGQVSGQSLLEVNQLLANIDKEMERRHASAKKRAEEAARAAKEAADQYAAGMKRITDILVQSTATMVDDTELAIERLRDELKAAGIAGENAARALRPLQDQLRLIKLNESLRLPEILEKSAAAWTPADVQRLRDAQAQLREMLRTTEQLVPGTKAWQEAQDTLARVTRRLREENEWNLGLTTATVAQVNAAIKPTEEWTRRAREAGLVLDENGRIISSTKDRTVELSQKVKDVALGAIGVAQGFGMISSEAASALQHVVGIADSLPKAFSGDPSAIFSVLGGLTGIIGSLFSGNSAEERARKELIRKNTDALRQLERTNGHLLRVNSPGFQLSGARDVLAQLLPQIRAGATDISETNFRRRFGALLGGAGLTVANLDEIAKNLGIQIRTDKGAFSIQGLTDLLKALETGQFTRFADEINEQFERIKTGIELGLIDPADELKEILKVLERPGLGKGVPAIARAFQGIDIGTAEGREQARGNLRSLFRDLERGTLTPADFGGLSGREFRDILVKLFDFLKEPASAGGETAGLSGAASTSDPRPAAPPPPPVVSGVSAGVDDSDTLGARIPATLDDLLGVNEEANRFLEQILASINAATAGGPLRPPAIPRGFLTQTAPVRAGVSVGDITITTHVHVAQPGATAQEIATATRQSLEETIDRLLYERLQRERAIRGDGGLP